MLRDFNTGITKERKKFHRRKEDFHFINIDLEIKSLKNLQPIIEELGDKVFVLFNDKPFQNSDEYWLSLEIRDYDTYQNFDDEKQEIGGVDIILSAFCNLLEGLSVNSKKLWERCHQKEFDVGFACGNTEKSYHTTIKSETLQRIAKLGATIHFTVYPFVNYDLC